MAYRTHLYFAALFILACSPKTEPTESASDTQPGTSSSGDDASSSLGHSQTSNAPESTSSGGGQTTTASPSEPGTISATVTSGSDTATDSGGQTDSFPESTTGTTSTTSTTTDTTSTTTGVSCNDIPNQPQNAECTDPSSCGCNPGSCFVIPLLGGFCGECTTDADCPDGGCTLPNPLQGVGALCNTGGAGDGCQSDSVCSDPAAGHCSAVIDVPGIITVATCGACDDNADCPAQAPNCSPDYDINGFTGQFSCKANGSVANNSGCELEEAMGVPLGNKACASGFCGEANVMGLLKFGICGECNGDGDCGPGQTCSDALVDLDQGVLIGSICM